MTSQPENLQDEEGARRLRCDGSSPSVLVSSPAKLKASICFSHLPLCMSKTQQAATTIEMSFTPINMSRQRSRNSLVKASLPETLERALHMFRTYPVMRVRGTAFENALTVTRRSSSVVGGASPSNSFELSSSLIGADLKALSYNRSMTDEWNTSTTHPLDAPTLELSSGMQRARQHESSVPLAASIKRAAMWSSIIVTCMAHSDMQRSFRYLRLCAALKKHFLPTILKRKELTGDIFPANGRSAMRDMNSITQSALVLPSVKDAEPDGSVLSDHSSFFASFHNSILMQSFAQQMSRHRYLPGEVIVREGELAQSAVYFLVSGKCEYRHELHEANGGMQRPQSEVLHSGSTFGGVFGGSSLFLGTYRAISQCIVWMLRREDFERVFTPVADESMMDTYISAMREQRLDWLRQQYRLPAVMGRVPIYRKLTEKMTSYVADFTPVVKVRGEVLFEQDDPPSYVYCIVEGCVRRDQKYPDGTYNVNTSQLLTPNDYASFNFAGRFLLVGEEPHILPGTQRYRCTVYSRAALLFRIDGERFVQALLDEPRYYIQLREKLTEQIRSTMKLDPACLGFAPLLRGFPETSLQALAQAAEPRVIRRSTSLCEPARHIKEIYFIMSGSVRDPRSFGHQPTQRLPTPPPSDCKSDDEGEGISIHGPRARAALKKATLPKKRGCPSGKIQHNGARSLTKAVFQLPEDDLRFTLTDVPDETTFLSNYKTSSAVGPRASLLLPHVYADEQVELNPQLLPNPSRRFLATAGGGWEGLIVEKWPNGWEAVTTVEAWALPTLKIRTEFSSLPKHVQIAILAAARQQQKNELGLDAIVVAKLPPLTAYLPHEVAVPPPLKTGTSGSHGTPSASRKRRGVHCSTNVNADSGGAAQTVSRHRRSASHDPSCCTEKYDREGEVLFGFPLLEKSGSFSQPEAPGIKARAPPKPVTPSAEPKRSMLVKLTKQPTRNVHEPFAGTTGVTDTELEDQHRSHLSLPSKKKVPCFSRLKHTPAKQSSKLRGSVHHGRSGNHVPVAPTNMLAIYNGEFKNDDPSLTNIVRDPLPALVSRESPSATDDTAHVTSWPAGVAPGRRWFKEIPSYEPLPGTMSNSHQPVSAPVFSPNSKLLTQVPKNYGRTLESQMHFFSASMRPGDTSEASTSKAKKTGTKAKERVGLRSVASSQFVGTRSLTSSRAVLPKRHVLPV